MGEGKYGKGKEGGKQKRGVGGGRKRGCGLQGSGEVGEGERRA